MRVLQQASRFTQFHENCVATIGKFDGVHLGHQLILEQVKQYADESGLPSLVMLIEPHPEEFFSSSPEASPARLCSLREKLRLLESFGIDFVLVLEFNQGLSQLVAEDYVEQILVEGLGVKTLVIGNDFRFGKDRGGDFSLLQDLGESHGFEVVESAAYERNGQRISSTFIRNELAACNFELVQQVLGRAYSISGRVSRGQQLGSRIGFPTCNIELNHLSLPLRGVYAVRARDADRYISGIANIGFRPTVSDGRQAFLEVHLFDFEGDLYDREIEVIFLEKIRDEHKFESIDALKAQIAIDVESARQYFARAA